MKNYVFVFFFIVVSCSIYLHRGRYIPFSSDEKVSIVIAMGQFPTLADKFLNPHAPLEYPTLLVYNKYSITDIHFSNVFKSIIQNDGSGFFYYFLLSFLIKAGGYNLIWLRFASVFLAGLNLYLMYILAGKFIKDILFQWTTIIMTAVNPVFIINTILVRSYMLALLCCLLSIYFLLKILSNHKPPISYFIFYFLSLLLAAGSHYFTIAVLGAEFVFISLTWWNVAFKREVFAAGYLLLILIASGWLWLTYPVSWQNLRYLIKDYHHKSQEATGYKLSIVNLIKQWSNITTYFFGFSTDYIGSIRIFLKCITTGLFLWVMYKLWHIRVFPQNKLLLFLIIFSMIFYSLQSVFEGQLFNFIPKYLVFIIPLVILAINIVLASLFEEKFKLTNAVS
jgi:uncharacterized membrane protein